MKQCPQCRTTYTDDTLRFCLADGTLLSEMGEQETAVRPRTVPSPEHPERTQTKGVSTVIKAVIALLVLGVLGLMALGGAGVIYYIGSAGNSNTAKNSPITTPSRSPTPDAEKERLENQLANLQRQLEDEVKAVTNRSATPSEIEPGAEDGRPTARVNSPNDGFLALREEPDEKSGKLLAKIPHGTVVALEDCETLKKNVAGQIGRWCMVTYEDQTGWVFDAWLD